MGSLCRQCGTLNIERPRCHACGSVRIVRHAELFSLSIAHVDCDAFFAAIEKRDRPELADKPVIVGGGHRGVVSTCCYVARQYGVRSAMPMFKARKACPQAVIIRPTMEKYAKAARQIRDLMAPLTPLVQPLSIDEAFLDLTGTERLHGAPPAAVLAELARQVEKEVGITLSVGLSHNKFLAKIASDLDKPRGFATIGRAETLSFLADKPPTMIYGVGASFGRRLEADGHKTLGTLQQADPKRLISRYGDHGYRLWQLARGEDARVVNPVRETKSVSGETTFNDDITDRTILEDHLYAMARKTSSRMKQKGLAGRVVTLKLKTSSFQTLTRRRSLDHLTNLLGTIYSVAQELLQEEMANAPRSIAYRLIGVGVSTLSPEEEMGADFLFAGEHDRLKAREDAIDSLRARFGDDAIGTIRDKHLRDG